MVIQIMLQFFLLEGHPNLEDNDPMLTEMYLYCHIFSIPVS